MMISEFIERTGFQPTTEEYHQIEELYYSFDGDKDEFCKWFLNGGGEKKIYEARARRIKHLEGMIEQQAKKHDEELAKLHGRIQDLQKQLDRELEWKPCDGGTVEVDTDDNRLRVLFDDVPDADLRAELKSNGFKWSPKHKAWQRQLTGNALYAAKRIKALAPIDSEEA